MPKPVSPRTLLLFGAAALLAACSYLPPTVIPVHPQPAPTEFRGLVDLMRNESTGHARVLFIHGMGKPNPCEPDTLLKHLSEALEAQVFPQGNPPAGCRYSVPEYVPVPGDRAHTPAQLYRYELIGDRVRVTFDFLRWSPLTDEPKKSLAEDGVPSRALLTNAIKSFEDDYLSDVLLYGGKYREVVRPAIERGLCVFVGGAPDPGDARLCDHPRAGVPTAIITHSLGGYVLMDALGDINDVKKARGLSAQQSAGVAVGSYLNEIFMLANQIKMLDLTTRTSETGPPQVVRKFREALRATRGARPAASLQLLAISDPNDILSWEITPAEFEDTKMTVANLYLGTTGQLLGWGPTPIAPLAASPLTAHLNYLKDDDVADVIVCGVRDSQILRCGP